MIVLADGSITISITGDAKGLEKELKKVNERIKQTGNESEKTGKQGSKIGSMISAGCKVAAAALAGVVTAAGGAALAAYKVGSDYETALQKVGTIADTAAKPLQTLSDEIMDLSSKTGIAASDIASATYDAISATGDTANAVSIVAQATQLATAGFASTGDSLSTLTGIMNAYGMQASDLEDISDSLIATQNLGVLTIGELSSSIGRAISTASAYGVGLSNLETGYIALTKAGIKCDESTTYLSSMFSELGDAGSKVGKILQEQTGKSFGQLMESGYSLSDVLQILYDDCGQDAEALMQLWGSQEAGKASNAIVSQGLQQFDSWLKQVEDSSGATASAYEQMQATVSAQTDILKNNIRNLGIKLYESFSPALLDAIQKINDALSSDQMAASVDALGQALSNAASSIGNFVSAVLPTLVDGLTWVLNHASEIASGVAAIGAAFAVIKVGTGVTKAIGAIKTLGSIAPAIGAAISAIGGPITLIIAAIAAVAAGIAVLWNTNEGFRNAVTGIWSAITGAIGGAVAGICTFFTVTVPAALSSLLAFFNSVWIGVTSVVFGAWSSITSTVSGAVNAVKSVISSTLNAVKSTITSILNGIKTTFSTVWNGVKSAVTTVVGNIKTAITKPIDQAKSTVTSTLDAIKKAFSDKMDAAREAVKTAIDKIKGFFNFSWKLPSLKLPHISISGGFSLNPPSVPHFSISWYKRAMGGAMLLDGATIFGMSGGRMLGGGESGHEYIVGQNLLKRDIKSSVSEALRNARLSLVIDTRTAAANASTAYTTNNVYNGGGKTSVTYNQTINSPKAMSRREVRRETKNVVKELKAYA